jgi:uncharacterized protein (TIGR02271 family)
MDLGEHLKPLSELGQYDIEKGDADPRGWAVVSGDGQPIGEVDDLIVDTHTMKVRYLVVELDDEEDEDTSARDARVLLDVTDVDLDGNERKVRARGYGAGGFGASSGAFAYDTRETDTERDQTTLTRSEEELRIGKREVTRGEVRVGKHVETEHVREPVTTRREEIVVERRPVEAGARADASIGEDEVRIPLMEEEVVVEKRPVVKEELVVGKRVVEERDVVETEVRREEFDIDDGTKVTSRDGEFDRNQPGRRKDR